MIPPKNRPKTVFHNLSTLISINTFQSQITSPKKLSTTAKFILISPNKSAHSSDKNWRYRPKVIHIVIHNHDIVIHIFIKVIHMHAPRGIKNAPRNIAPDALSAPIKFAPNSPRIHPHAQNSRLAVMPKHLFPPVATEKNRSSHYAGTSLIDLRTKMVLYKLIIYI